eukprot:TRINITY_DN5582_c0_g1_i1.p1 TRINITY_DN5582_c0_g1~~TRINITY_DN5582_c0_g1_i1.p1  ORF type:complete len:633 (+),score=132.08 TRINITY_DN5582_c0_g1_i1:1-1899(+)
MFPEKVLIRLIVIMTTMLLITASKNNFGDFVISMMDLAVDPCNDFYRYSCDGWINTNVLPDDTSREIRFITDIEDKNEVIIKEILEDPKNEKVNKFYTACMDEKLIEQRGSNPIKPLMELIDRIQDITGFMEYIAIMHSYGFDVLFNVFPDSDPENPSMNILQMYQGGLGLPDESLYEDEEVLTKYGEHISNMFDLYHPSDMSRSMAQSALIFEIALSQVTVSRDDLIDPFDNLNRFDWEEFKALSKLPWSYYIDYTSINEEIIQDVNVIVPRFYAGLTSIVKNITSSWKPYLKWQLLHNTAEWLSKDFRNENFKFYGNYLQGEKELPSRSKFCIRETHQLGELLGKYFQQSHWSDDDNTNNIHILSTIMQAMEYDLNHVKWMDDVTRSRALKKLKHVEYLIGGPQFPNDYSTIKLTDNLFENELLCRNYNSNISLFSVGMEVDKYRWFMTSDEVNAYYDPTRNQMVFPAGQLQDPYYSSNFPESYNYAGAGATMAHELTHGFDNQGRDYDYTGKLRDWWESPTRKEYNRRADCVIQQYSEFEVYPGAGVYVNGNISQGENIADIGGVKLSFNAYKKSIGEANLTNLSEVPGLTNAQLFFVGYAQGWCTITTKESLRVRAKTDVHSPSKFRV